MPSSSRPRLSVITSILTSSITDKTLGNVISSDNAKHFSTLFEYVTSLAFAELFLKPLDSADGKTGKEIMQEIPNTAYSTYEFLSKAGIIQSDVPSEYTVRLTEQLFNAFARDKALSTKLVSGVTKFIYLDEISLPAKDDLAEAKILNKYLFIAAEDLTRYIIPSLIKGKGVVFLSDPKFSILYEALLADPFFITTRVESYKYVWNKKKKFAEHGIITISSLQVSFGVALFDFLDIVLKNVVNTDISVVGYNFFPYFNERAKTNIKAYIESKKEVLQQKNLSIAADFQLIDKGNFKSIIDQNTQYDFVIIPQIFMFYTPEKQEEIMEVAHDLIHSDGTVIIIQSTSFSNEFPFPFLMLYMSIEDFYDIPQKDEFSRMCKKYFKTVKSKILESAWLLQDPK